jgi:hypothetical protein
MKKQYLFLVLATCLMGSAMAQTTITDSIETGAAYTNDVYYSLQTGKVSEVPNSNWQLGFSIGNNNVAVRANTGVGTTNNGKTAIYEMPGVDHNWAPFDTTGYKTWKVRNNSDEDWESGALNYPDTNNQFDYGWGEYDMSTHAVNGHRLYLAVVTNGTTPLFKKIWIRSKVMGTWNISFANIDGTDSVGLSIASTTYSTKNFVYVSLVSGTIVDREPAKANWDFVYTRYLPNIPGYPTVTGMLTGAGVSTSEVRGIEETASTLADTTSFSYNISTIGSDWKSFNGSAYVMKDSLTYFVKSNTGAFWKLVFTGFIANVMDSSRPGRAIFNKTNLTPTTGIATVGEEIKNVVVYPNPTNDVVNVLMDVTAATSTIAVSDLSGRTLLTETVEGNGFINKTIDLSSFTTGIYFISISNGNSRSVQKVVVN